MPLEYHSDRDVPLIAILVAAALVAAFGLYSLVFYTPYCAWLQTTMFWSAIAVPAIAPLVYHLAYRFGKTLYGYAVVAVVFAIALGLFTYNERNGAGDTSEAKHYSATLVDKYRRQHKAGYTYLFIVNAPAMADCNGKITVRRELYEKIPIGTEVVVRLYTGRFGLPWIDRAVDPDEVPDG